MNEQHPQTNVIAFLPLTVALWSCYLLALVLIDHFLYPRPIFPPRYYLVNGGAALISLGLVHCKRQHRWQKTIVLPATIILLTVVPIVTTRLLVPWFPGSPAHSPEAFMLRQMPPLLIALILTAWQYGWRIVLLFNGSIALLTVVVYLGFMRPGGLLLPPLTVLLIQIISFLVVGYFISTLICRLQQQQRSLAQANERLTAYATTLEELTISRERNRMARELHDTVAHTLSGLSVQLETVKAYWEIEPERAQGILDTALTTTRAGLQETRRALKSLRASPLEDMGLLLALRQMATETAERANFVLDLSLPQTLPVLTPTVEQCIYRVAQEAINNVAHHANARNLLLHLTCNDGVLLEVRDDGIGFNPQQTRTPGHFGLPGMQERAALVGSLLTITSQPGQGTTIQLHIKG
jgi:signal transduction histidine kinase